MTANSTQTSGEEDRPYKMTLSYNVLNHLGLNLYSNVPAVLSEAVANGWDADAEEVEVKICPDDDLITISDDGHGMTESEVNERFLNVGYSRRADEERDDTSDDLGRPVMGRKGIGKLSLFSISNVVEVHTKKDGQENAFRMVVDEIEEKIKSEHEEGQDPTKQQPYYPPPIEDFSSFPDDRKQGTHIVLTDLKKETWQAAKHLRRRLARRFSIIGSEYDFDVSVNDEQITVDDRDYFHKVQYLWTVGDADDRVTERSDAEKVHNIDGNLSEYVGDELDEDLEISGWIATPESAGNLDTDSGDLNKISILMRGKLAQEDILSDITEGNIYMSYLFGELHADFLDDTDKEDAATSDRERIKKTDPRYRALLNFVKDTIREVGSKWKSYRQEKGVEEATEFESIGEWYEALESEHQERARQMFGAIHEMGIDDRDEKRQLFTHSVLAFESLRQKDSLEKLEQVSPSNWREISHILGEIDDIEATLYHQIVKQRLGVIRKLKEDTEENVIERVLQEHLYEYPWLLDPAWERATQEIRMEEEFQKLLEDEGKKILSDSEASARFDLMLMETSGKYLLVELKRYEPTYSITGGNLIDQVSGYRKALEKVLQQHKGQLNPNIEIVCVIGDDLDDWEDKSDEQDTKDMLNNINARIVRYDELIDDAYSAYQEFLDAKEEELGRIERIVDNIRDEMSEDAEQGSEKEATAS